MKKVKSNFSKGRVVLSFLMSAFLVLTVGNGVAFAAESWGAFGNTTASGGGGPSNGTTDGSGMFNSSCMTGSDEPFHYAIDCTGLSWVFYRYISQNVKDTNKQPVQFVPQDTGGSLTEISGTCADPDHAEAGFWHFGQNAYALGSGTYSRWFSSYDYLVGKSPIRYAFGVNGHGWGHNSSQPYSHLVDPSLNAEESYVDGYRHISGDTHNKYDYDFTRANLAHRIFRDGVAMYEAQEVSTNPTTHTNSAVSQAWQDAAKACNEGDCPTETTMPTNPAGVGTTYFCWYKGMGNPTLNVNHIQVNCDGTEEVTDTEVVKPGDATKVAKATKKEYGVQGFEFDRWEPAAGQSFTFTEDSSHNAKVDLSALQEGESYTINAYYKEECGPRRLIIKFEGLDSSVLEEKVIDCNGNETVTTTGNGSTPLEEKDSKVPDNGKNDQDSTEGKIKARSFKWKRLIENDGWVYDGAETPSGTSVDTSNYMVYADVPDEGDVEVILKFKKENKDVKEIHEVCGECGEWMPNEYKTSTAQKAYTRVRIGVRNVTLKNHGSDYGDWHHDGPITNGLKQNEIYAKPTDEVQWKFCYYPGVEKAAYSTVTKDNDHHEPHPTLPTTVCSDTLDNQPFSQAYAADWPEEYEVSTTNLKPFPATDNSYKKTYSTPVGNSDVQQGALPNGSLLTSDSEDIATESWRKYTVRPLQNNDEYGKLTVTNRLFSSSRRNDPGFDPGQTLSGTIKTTHGFVDAEVKDAVYEHWECGTEEDPKPAKHENGYYENTTRSGESDTGRVVVPYNFRNTADVRVKCDDEDDDNTCDEDVVKYSGENVEIENAIVHVGIRKNEETAPEGDEYHDGYATQVDNAKVRLAAFVVDADIYEADNEHSGVWNPDETFLDDADNYGNEIPDDYADRGARLWESSSEEICGTNGDNNAFNAKEGVCKYLEMPASTDIQLNETGDMGGEIHDVITGKEHYNPDDYNFDTSNKADTYSVFDTAAGNYFCVSAAVWPFSVKSDKETEASGDQTWYISKPSCVKIAKKPTFQVWGAGIYSGGNIKTKLSTKNNILEDDAKIGDVDPDEGKNTGGVLDQNDAVTDTKTSYQSMDSKNMVSNFDWAPHNVSGRATFGSWGELSASVVGGVEGFGSGASLGYFKGYWEENPGESPWKFDPMEIGKGIAKGTAGGAQDSLVNDHCQRNTLTIGWNSCALGGFNAQLATTLQADIDALLERFPEGEDNSLYKVVSGGDITSNIYDGTKKTVVYKAGSNLKISSNIVYSGTEGLHALLDVPKLFIVAGGDVNIDCNVQRIDAIIIAKGTVNTCANDDIVHPTGSYTEQLEGYNLPERGNQLVINGAILAGRIEFDRTYGAGTGMHSITPAEIINYDSSLYLWAAGMSESSVTGRLTEAATRELAPRY